MRALSFAALGVAAYLVFLAAGLPASFLLARAQEAQPGKFEVREARGTAWHGSAAVTIATPGGPVAVDRLEWNWLPSRLAAGRFAFDIAAGTQGVEARYEGSRTFSGWEVRDLDVKGNAATLSTIAPWIAAARPEGIVSVTSPKLTTDGRELRGEARIEWRGASISLSDVKPLGSYRADIVAEGHAGRLDLTTLEGALQVSGKGTLTPPTQLTFTGEGRAAPDQAKALEPLLNLMGPARPNGARPITWRLN